MSYRLSQAAHYKLFRSIEIEIVYRHWKPTLASPSAALAPSYNNTPCQDKEGATDFFRCNFYKYKRIFVIFCAQFSILQENVKNTRYKNFLPHIRFVVTIYSVKFSDTKVTHFTQCWHLARAYRGPSIKFMQTRIDKTNKTHPIVTG